MPVRRTDNTKKVLRNQRRAIIAGLLVTAELGATKIRDETPVLTGRLRESIKSDGRVEEQNGQFTIKISTPVKYAPPVEFGTSKMAPRAMFRKGINNNVKLLKQLFERTVKSRL